MSSPPPLPAPKSKPLKFIWDSALFMQSLILVASSLFVAGIIALAAILRYVFKTDLYGIEEIVMVAAFWLYFIGASYGSYEDSHIKAGLLAEMLKSPAASKAVRLTALAVEIGTGLVLTYWAWNMIVWALVQKPKTPGWGIYLFIPQSAIFMGFALMTFYALCHFIRRFKESGS